MKMKIEIFACQKLRIEHCYSILYVHMYALPEEKLGKIFEDAINVLKLCDYPR